MLLWYILGSSKIFKMFWKKFLNTFENNGDDITKNIVKMTSEENIKSLLYNHLVYIYVKEADF